MSALVVPNKYINLKCPSGIEAMQLLGHAVTLSRAVE